ncbi:uncharacterized protein [Onthophagus taurus]|uniref:uncharacterized protein n=1 Tax=Onthophagus taurus TaxID=166361 RepID=UPI000C2084EC|nr:uncharacterized protein LOC111426677 [Onthophagus taurus]
MASLSRYALIKMLELAIVVVCIWLHHEARSGDFTTDFISATAFGGFAIILVAGAVGHIMGSPITRRIDLFFCLVGIAVFVAAGALNIKHFENSSGKWKDYGLAKGSLAVINGVFFLLDAVTTWRGDF